MQESRKKFTFAKQLPSNHDRPRNRNTQYAGRKPAYRRLGPGRPPPRAGPSGLRQDPHPGLPRALGPQPRGGLRGHALPDVHQPRRPRDDQPHRRGDGRRGLRAAPCGQRPPFLFPLPFRAAGSARRLVHRQRRGDHQHPGRLHPRRRGARDPRLPVQPQLPADTLLLPPHGSDAPWPSVEPLSPSRGADRGRPRSAPLSLQSPEEAFRR